MLSGIRSTSYCIKDDMLVLRFAVALLVLSVTANEPRELAMMQQVDQDDQQHRAAAIQLNTLAGNIRSGGDARAFINAIADMLSPYLAPQWLDPSIRSRVATAEYASIVDRSRLVSEEHITEVWNQYVEEIRASDESRVTVAELHSIRTAAYASQRATWSRGINQTVWTMPNIYARRDDGELAEGCRAIEALLLVHMMHDVFDNILSARKRLQVASRAEDSTNITHPRPSSQQQSAARFDLHTTADPVRAAEEQYVREHGQPQLNSLIQKSFDRLFSE